MVTMAFSVSVLVAAGENALMKHTPALCVALGLGVLFTPFARAQTNLYVGSNTPANTLDLTNGTNAYANTYVGYTVEASNNALGVANAGTLLTNTNNLYVGYAGSGNSMTVADGGVVANRQGYIGFTNTASNNSVLVTGGGSTWTNTYALYVGYSGSSNNLVISTGGTVAAVYGYIGFTNTSSNNSVLVTGADSLWTNRDSIYVGLLGNSNNLVISNGGAVAASDGGYIGANADSFNNRVLVTGADSIWTNNFLYVGYEGSSNSLVISNAGTVVNSNGYIGYDSNSTGNTVLVTGTGSLWTNSGILFVGENGAGNSLVISDGGRVISDLFGAIGNVSSASNNSVLVTGTNSAWLSDALVVGFNGSGNSLIISNGGGVTLVAAQSEGFGGIIGFGADSTGNSVLVTGTSGLETLGALVIGYGGSSNSLVISNGGTVANAESVIGFELTASNNSVVVTGTGSLWTNSSDLYVGSSGNSLTLADGGTVAASSISIATSIATNAVSSGTLNIGRFGTNDTGGTIISPTIAFGAGTGAINFNQSDAVTITSAISGAGTLNQLGAGTTTLSGANTYSGPTGINGGQLIVNGSISNNSSLYVGESGSGNSMVISNAGTVASGTGYIGFTNTASNNSVLVAGTNSVWTNSGDLNVGYFGSSNSLVISDGGTVANGVGVIGVEVSSSNNSVLVTDGGTWTDSGDLYVGLEGSGNSLVISNGGMVQNNAGVIGEDTNALNNSVLVTGAASTWTNSGALTIAQRGSGTLTVVSGGSVASSGITIASSNTATGTLNIGRFGTNDTGGTIIAPTIAFGSGTGAINFNQSNAVTITSAISGNGVVNQLGTGTTTLSGANTYTRGTVVSAGSLVGTTTSLQGAITNNAAVTFDQSTDGTYSGAMSGSGSLSKTGIGRLSLSGSSSYNGATAVSAGDLNLSGGSIANSAVTVASGASLSGYGSVGTIGGAGAINPGNSPGILTTPQVDPSGGTDFNLEMTGTAPTYNNASNSLNDLIQITGGTPFSQALAAGNGVFIYFSGAALFTGSTAVQYQGGFFTDQSASFASSISGATYNYYFANTNGPTTYNGVSYYNKAQYESLVLGTNMSITVTTVAQTANFGSGDINGQVMQVQVIPEPSTYALLALAAAGWGAHWWRRKVTF